MMALDFKNLNTSSGFITAFPTFPKKTLIGMSSEFLSYNKNIKNWKADAKQFLKCPVYKILSLKLIV